ncbi:MAG: hypothetical protein QXI11_02065 [Thermoproteota archaeon]
MIDWLQLIAGLFVGGIINAVWYYLWADFDEKHLGKYRYRILSWFEHFHWATILYILFIETGITFFFGMATIFLVDESVAQNHKFSLGSGHEPESFSIWIIIILIWIILKH